MKWWSESKRQYMELEKMHNAHITAALKKLERGEYREGNLDYKPNADEEAGLREALLLECQRRGIGPFKAPEATE